MMRRLVDEQFEGTRVEKARDMPLIAVLMGLMADTVRAQNVSLNFLLSHSKVFSIYNMVLIFIISIKFVGRLLFG